MQNPLLLLRDLGSKLEPYWLDRGQKSVLRQFHAMARRVPAYKDFLKKHRLRHELVKSISDLQLVPPVDKHNYLKAYPLESLCWDGKFKTERFTFSSTSGTTGEPFYFPRTIEQDWQYALTAELYLRTNFQIKKKSTLYVNAFAMGAWIGGLFTYEAVRLLAERGKYKLSIITPGLNKPEIFKAIKRLGPMYDQVILGGYPPFIKDTLDEAWEFGVDLKKYNIKFIFSAEGFSEGFRNYVAKKVGLKNIYTDILNHYGTVDLGTMSYETPLSVLLRRLGLRHKTLYTKLFPYIHRLPTLTQFLPEMFYFESVDGNLFASANSGYPLVRYDLKDRGGVFFYKDLSAMVEAANLDFTSEINKAGINDTVWQLPFVYVYERSDMVVSWSGANIYPEHIKQAHQHRNVSKSVTGKFTMELKTDSRHNPYLEVHTELKKGIKPTLSFSKRMQEIIIDTLLKKNSEFRSNYYAIPDKNIPKVTLWHHESVPHFKGGGKQTWTIKRT